jgi:hypothetical protein
VQVVRRGRIAALVSEIDLTYPLGWVRGEQDYIRQLLAGAG